MVLPSSDQVAGYSGVAESVYLEMAVKAAEEDLAIERPPEKTFEAFFADRYAAGAARAVLSDWEPGPRRRLGARGLLPRLRAVGSAWR